MAIVSLSPVFNGFQSFLANGLPNNAGFIYTYQAGTTTPQATYTTNLGTITNANPIPLGVDGRPPQEIWLTVSTAYKFIITDSLLNQVGTPYDNIVPSLSSANNLSDVSNPATALANLGGVNSAQVAAAIQSQTYTAFTTGGTSSAYTVTASPALTSYNNARLALTINAIPTGSPTQNWNGLGAKNWKYYDSTGTKQFVTSTQVSGTNQITDNWYDGTDIILLNPLPVSGTSKIQSITSSVATNALTLNYNGGTLDFRNATLSNGSPVTLVISANSIVVPSTATLGTANGIQARLALLEAYNGGSPVACVVNTAGTFVLDESLLISPTTISAGSTSANTVYSASAVSANSPFRIVGYYDITEATAGTWVTDATTKQGVGGQVLLYAQPSQVRLNTSNGYGATNTRILRYTNIATNVGTDITYADSAANGASITINTNGYYNISAGYNNAGTGGQFGLSLNSSQLTTNIASITVTDILCIATCGSGNSNTLAVNILAYFKIGDVIRPHGDAGATGSAPTGFLNIVRVK